jgi:hypothetical protein
MAYFKRLTGSKLPKPVAKKFKVGDNKFEYGVIYKIKTDKGYFTLRNKSTPERPAPTPPPKPPARSKIISMYRVNKFTLRDLSSSKVKGGTTERWTIDINKGALGNNKKLEIKFK